MKTTLLMVIVLGVALLGIIYLSNTDKSSMFPNEYGERALQIAEAELEGRGHSNAGLKLITAEPVKGSSTQWFIKYDREDALDASVEMIIDVEKGVVISYHDSWT